MLFIFLYTLKFCLSEGENVLLPSNELGDFLAGAFAPLAFLFLILGYKQQGQELKLQAQELANLVKEQQLQNSIHKSQIEQKRFESKPMLDFKDASYTYKIYDDDDNFFEGHIFYFHILNHGKLAKQIIVTGNGIIKRIHKLDTDVLTSVSFSFPDDMDRELSNSHGKLFSIQLDITYLDNIGYEYRNTIKLSTEVFRPSAIDQDYDLRIEVLS
nr:hypothetical protein [Acinetobacter pittii]